MAAANRANVLKSVCEDSHGFPLPGLCENKRRGNDGAGVNEVHAGQAADFDFNERSRNVF